MHSKQSLTNKRVSFFTKIFVLKIFITLSCPIYVQAQGRIEGTVIDSAQHSILPLATISIYKAADTSLITYRLTDSRGVYKITGIPLNVPCRAIITYTGYKTARREFTLHSDTSSLKLDTISLTTLAGNMEEVVVLSERPPVLVKKDMIEFNASSFKTLPNAVVEDLLKKLPGVQVDKEGNIMVNGKRVNKILVDGKSFFGNDPKMASKNLPATSIDKVQVTDDLDELNANGDDNKNKIGKVINLTFKKGFKKGYFGKAYAGGGTNQRYEAGAIANLFKDTLQVSVLGYTNNLNKPGFGYTDLMQTGGMSRSGDVTGNQSISINNSTAGSSIQINGVNFGGQANQGGVTASSGMGFNLNHSPSQKKAFFAQYYYGHVNTGVQNEKDARISFGDTVLKRLENNTTAIIGSTHIANAGIQLKPDSLTTINSVINFSHSEQDNTINTLQNSSTNFYGQLNNGLVKNNKLNRNNYYRQGGEWIRLFGKKGRKLSVSEFIQYNDRNNDYTTRAQLSFQFPTAFDSLMNQLRVEQIPQLNMGGSINFRNPLTKGITLRISGRYENEQLKNGITSYSITSGGTLNPAPDLTSRFKRMMNKGSVSTGIEFKLKEWAITPGIRLQAQKFKTEFTRISTPLLQQQTNLLPQLAITHKDISFNYDRDIVLPSYKYLIAVRDNTNPYVIMQGNTSLLPSLKDNISMQINDYNPKTSLNIWGWVNAALIKRDVIQNITLNKDGVRTILPVNADGTKSFSANFGVNKQNKTKTSFTWDWNIGGYISYNNNKYLYNQIASRQKSLSYSNWSSVGLNWNDKFEWNTDFNFNINSTRNTNDYFKAFSAFSYAAGTEFISRPVKHLVLETQLSYNFNRNIVNPAYRDFLLWKAAVNITMLKQERGVLKFSAFDLLRQMLDADISTYQNTVEYVHTNTLQQYFMVSFTYNILAKGRKQKVGGQWGLW